MDKENSVIDFRMSVEKKAENALAVSMRELGDSPAVERYISGYGNVRAKQAYALQLALYLRWLKTRGILMTPDALVKDNLRAVFESGPTDIETKRKHTDLLAAYINGYLIERELSESNRKVAEAAIKGFYRANDSPLFGHWKRAEQKPETPPPALRPDDVRKVLAAMPARVRTPLVLSWQSGIEIHRVLEMDWSFALDKTPRRCGSN